jgi:hypothetical protein
VEGTAKDMADLRKELEDGRDSLFREIGLAAQNGSDVGRVIELTRQLEAADAALELVSRAEAILESLMDRDATSTGDAADSDAPKEIRRLVLPPGALSRRRTSRAAPRPSHAKADAEERRGRYVERLARRGVNLTHVGGVNYRTKEGVAVAIPTATEREPNRWFLGLLADSFDIALLLCEDASGDIHDFVLDQPFLATHGARLSRDGRSQLKFNVLREGGRFMLKVPFHGPIDIDEGDLGTLR